MAARALYALNRFGEATGHADRVVEIWDAHGSTPLELGEALLISARMGPSGPTPTPLGPRRCGPLTSLNRSGPSHALALCYSTLCAQDVLQARFGAAATWSRRALELAPRVGASDVVAHAPDTGGWLRRRRATRRA